MMDDLKRTTPVSQTINQSREKDEINYFQNDLNTSSCVNSFHPNALSAYPNNYNGVMTVPQQPDKADMLLHNQFMLGNDFRNLESNVNAVLYGIRKERKKLLNVYVAENQNGQLVFVQEYDNEKKECCSVFVNESSALDVITLYLKDNKYVFFILHNKEYVLLAKPISKLKDKDIYDTLMQNGLRINVSINKAKRIRALYDYFMWKAKSHNCDIVESGYAGWNGNKFKVALDYKYLEDYKYDLDIPVLMKYFNKNASNLDSGFEGYTKCLCRVKDLETRVWLALVPFSALFLTLFLERGLYVPYVLNFVFMSKNMKLHEISEYLQIFNRDKSITVYDVDNSEKNLKECRYSSKDEVLIFSGIQDDYQSDYKNRKIKRNLNSIAQEALQRSNNGGLGKEIKSIIVFLSDQRVRQLGVKHIFISDDVFDLNAVSYDLKSLESTWAFLIQYVELFYDEICDKMKEESIYNCKAERYWKILIKLINDALFSFGKSLNNILNLPEEFSFEFLWDEREMNLDEYSETVIKAIRNSMPNIDAVHKKVAQCKDEFVFDEDSIWILPSLFEKILNFQGLGTYKNDLLLGCKEDNLLQAREYESYTTRLQLNLVRGEYYRFDRRKFTETGQIELIALARGVKDAC